MSVGRICSRVVVTVSSNESIRVAAQRMAEKDVGTLVVVDPNRVSEAVGIITDRDLAIRCIGGGLDPDQTQVSKVMTAPVQSVDEETSIEEALSRMAGAATRRLVVTGTGRSLVGILSLDDVLELLVEEAASIGRLLEKQRPRLRA
jgi:CBS domain-containing protein